MTWLLLDPGGSQIASGSWWGVVEQGAEIGVIQLRESRHDGSMACPKLMPGFAMVPEAMLDAPPAQADLFHEAGEGLRYG